MSSALAIPSAIPETLEIWSSEPLRVVRLGLKRYKVVGFEIMFDLCPAVAKSETASVTGHDPYKLITKNREIVMQGENAAKLSENEWLLVHRLNEAGHQTGKYFLSLDQLCDSEQGEPLWGINDIPTPQTLRNLAYNAGNKLTKANIFASIKFSVQENGFTLVIYNENLEEQSHDDQYSETTSDPETPPEPIGRGKQKKATKRNADA